MRVVAAVIAWSILITFPAGARERPTRVVSMNLCVDQYLIALADKDQVAALSNYARDPQQSYYAAQAASYPRTSGSVEEVLALHPDLVIAGTSRRQGAIALLRRQGLRIIEISPADTYQTIVAETRQIAAVLGQTARGEALIARMDVTLAAIPPTDGHQPEAAAYQRRGYLAGTHSLVDDMMRRAGLDNLATRLGRKTVGPLSLEELIQARPDYLLIDAEADPHADNGSAMLFHPALEAIVPPSHRLALPRAMMACGGPFFADAVARLAAQVK